jgi:hypothetical protein
MSSPLKIALLTLAGVVLALALTDPSRAGGDRGLQAASKNLEAVALR